ncbi:hypothetical protein [Heliorestis convoluta]|uniref:Uncharacterized protein n=1 Tax=Heliorestis convoluta TaxID=356322 RepID=A0A5Q2MZ83_9FIRM|nr:hypothetical protein [Heliorestis convoluta]QGG46753.1 hypothetical protein FTV88_0574 [Heliorestis convoluta]
MAEIIIALSILSIVAWIFLKPGYQHHTDIITKEAVQQGDNEVGVKKYSLKRTKGERILKRRT